MRSLLASPLGFLVGLSLGALGSGGSILAVPVLVYIAGQEPNAATSASLLVVGAAAATGLVGHARAGRVRFLPGAVFGLTGIAGSLVGSAVSRGIDGDLLLLGFGLLILAAAWRMGTGCPSCTKADEEQNSTAEADNSGSAGTTTLTRSRVGGVTGVVRFVAAGTAVGFLTGLFGVGGGFVIVPALTLALGFGMTEAIGTSLLVVAINTAVALGARLGTTGVDWGVALPFAAAAVVGVHSGNRIAGRVDAEVLQRWFAAFLVALSLYITGTAVADLVTT